MTIKEQLKAKEIDISKIELSFKEQQFFKFVKENKLHQIEQLIFQGVNINAKDKDGWTALMHATDTDSYKIAKTLLEFGADIDMQDEDGQTALMNAIFVNAIKTAKLLISSGANVNIKDSNGQTPLMIAALSDSKEIGDLLILNGAKAETIDNFGKDAFTIAHETWSFKKGDYFFKEKPKPEEITKKRIEYYFSTIPSLKKFGGTFNISTFINEYNNKYDESIEEKDFNDFVDVYNSNTWDRVINYLNKDTIQIYPNAKEIFSFLSKLMKTIYSNTKIIEINDMNNHFSKKFNCILGKTQLNDFVSSFNDSHQEKDLVINGDNIYVYIKRKEIYDFLFSLFKPLLEEYKTKKIKVIQDAFIKKYHFGLAIEELDSYISFFNEPYSIYYTFSSYLKRPYASRKLVRIGPDTIQVYPSEEESVAFIKSLFLKQSVDNIKVKNVQIAYFQHYNCKLDDKELSKCISYCNEYTYTKFLELKDNDLFFIDFFSEDSADFNRFRCPRRDLLDNMGASWFVSYAYSVKLDYLHSNWVGDSSVSSRISTYNNNTKYHEAWLKQVLLMDDIKLGSNSIGLSGPETKRLAKKILRIFYWH